MLPVGAGHANTPAAFQILLAYDDCRGDPGRVLD
jgi:hypothetical protein